MKMAKIDLPKRSGKRSKVREKSVKRQGILKTILSGNPDYAPYPLLARRVYNTRVLEFEASYYTTHHPLSADLT